MGKYIHEKADWPDFEFDASLLQDPLLKLHRAHARLFGMLDALGFDVRNELQLDAIADEVVTSSEIEGEIINRSSVRSSVAKRLGLDSGGLIVPGADRYTEGVIEMTMDATQNYMLPVTDERLFAWHSSLFPTGWNSMRRITVGAYRTEEVSIVSGVLGKEKVHYTAPAPGRVPGEMKRYLEWLEAERDVDPYAKAGIAHQWFEAIHPFDDGKMGEALQVLARHGASRYRRYD